MPLDVIGYQGAIAYQAGGTAANVAAILAFLGWDAALAGQTGDDRAGQIFIDDLQAAGVNTSQIYQPVGMATPRLIHQIHSGEHSYAYSCPKCERRLPRSRPLTLGQASLCFESIPAPDVYFFDRANAATLFLAECYADAGSVIVFEPSVPANAELLRRAVVVAHVVKHSDDRSIGGLDDLGVEPQEGQIRIVTHGVGGLEVRSGGEAPKRFPALAAPQVDSGGAGDWTTAGLITIAVRSGRLDSEAIDSGLRFGQALAALSCTAPGARGLMGLTRRTVTRRARDVLAQGSVLKKPRFARPTQHSARGACSTCLMPYAVDSAKVKAA
ncbi:MAG: hypothetical protein KDB54_04870 [Solirubrobacterales bacterium]|nr:hypothetical protein [Solirubrobacterales bacterium]